MKFEDLTMRIDELTEELNVLAEKQSKKSISFLRQRYAMNEPFHAEFTGEGRGKAELRFTVPAVSGAPFTVRVVLDNEVIIEELCYLDGKENDRVFSAETDLQRGTHTIGVTFDTPHTAEKFALTVTAQNVAKAVSLTHLDYAEDGDRRIYLAIYEKNCSLYDENFVMFDSYGGMETLARTFFINSEGVTMPHFFFLGLDKGFRIRPLHSSDSCKIADNTVWFSLARSPNGGCVAYHISTGVIYRTELSYNGSYVATTAPLLQLAPYVLKSVHSPSPDLLYVQFEGGGRLYSLTGAEPVCLCTLPVVNAAGCYLNGDVLSLYYPSKGKTKAHLYNLSAQEAPSVCQLPYDAYLRVSPSAALALKDSLLHLIPA